MSDLVDAATEQPIRHGAQIAELVQLRVLFRDRARAGAARRAAGRSSRGARRRPIRAARRSRADARRRPMSRPDPGGRLLPQRRAAGAVLAAAAARRRARRRAGGRARRARRRCCACSPRCAPGSVRELRGQPAAGVDATRDDVRRLRGARRLRAVAVRPRPAAHDAPAPRVPRLPAVARRRVPGDPAGPSASAPAGEADVALQLTGATAAAVNRAAVEVWKLIEDERLPLAPVAASFDGFGRPDGRGWLEFHDGVGNMPSRQRLAAIAAPPTPRWMAAGPTWRSCGCASTCASGARSTAPTRSSSSAATSSRGDPLVAVRRDARGRASPVATPERPPFDPPADRRPAARGLARAPREPEPRSPDSPAALRIFRQGYDFLDAIGPDGPRARAELRQLPVRPADAPARAAPAGLARRRQLRRAAAPAPATRRRPA